MQESAIIEALGALGQSTRLRVFRLLVAAGPEGLAAGDISARLDVLPNTLSANLSVLSNAGLITKRREGRSIRYAIDFDGLRDLLTYLLQDCCGGRPEQCSPLLDAVCCPDETCTPRVRTL